MTELQDLRLAQKALLFDTTPDKRQRCLDRVMKTVDDPTASDRNTTQAVKAIMQMERLNLAVQQLQMPQLTGSVIEQQRQKALDDPDYLEYQRQRALTDERSHTIIDTSIVRDAREPGQVEAGEPPDDDGSCRCRHADGEVV